VRWRGCFRHGWRERGFVRHLSPPIVSKRNYLAVDLTVSSAYPAYKSRYFRYLKAPATIEWE
jgi:hypothetical protein